MKNITLITVLSTRYCSPVPSGTQEQIITQLTVDMKNITLITVCIYQVLMYTATNNNITNS